MSLRIAMIYKDDTIYVEFSPEKFREILKEYFEETKDIDATLDKVIKEIKLAAQRK